MVRMAKGHVHNGCWPHHPPPGNPGLKRHAHKLRNSKRFILIAIFRVEHVQLLLIIYLTLDASDIAKLDKIRIYLMITKYCDIILLSYVEKNRKWRECA